MTADFKIDFNFFPNPVSKNLSISCEQMGNYQISVIDLTGRLVLQKQFYGQDFNLNTESLEAGVYSLKLEGSNESVRDPLPRSLYQQSPLR